MIRITQTGKADYLIQSSQKAEKNINKKQQKINRRSREAEEKRKDEAMAAVGPVVKLDWRASIVWVQDPLDQPRFLHQNNENNRE